MRSVDHLILGVRDVQRARALYARLGFYMSPQMFHSVGSSNSLLMFQHTFLELAGDFHKVDSSKGFTEVAVMCRMIEENPGIIGCGFLSNDADSDYRNLTENGIAMSRVQSFTRPVPMPDGSAGEVYCSVTLSQYPSAPRLNFFISHQHRPQYVWIPEWQRHPNTVRDIVRVTYVVRDPGRHRHLVEAFVGAAAQAGPQGALRYVGGRGEVIEFLDASRSDHAASGGPGAQAPNEDRAVAVRLKVQSLAALTAVLEESQVPFTIVGSMLRVQAPELAGTALEFVE